MIPSDIQPLIRLAATLPVGSLDRRTILASLKKQAAFADDLVARVDVMSGSMGGKDADRGPLLKAVQAGLPESVFNLEEFTAEAFPRYGVTSLDELRKAEDLTDEDRAELKSLEDRIKPFSAMVAKVEKWSGTKLGQDLAEGLSLVSGKTDHKLREAVWAGVAKGMHGDVEKLESGRRVVTDTGRGSLTTPGALGTEPEDLVQVMLAGGIELPGMIFDKNMSDKTYYEGVRVRGTFKPRKELFKPGTSVYTLAGAKIKPTKISELRSVRGYAKSVASTTAIDWKRSVHIGTEYILAEGDASAPDPEHAMNMGGKVSLESLLGADLIDGVTVSKQMTLARYYIKKIRQVMKRALPKGVQAAVWEAVAEMITKGINPWKGQGRGGEFAVDYNAIEKFLDTRDGQKILDENEITADSINKNNVQKNWVRVREKMLKALSQLSDDDLLASIHLSLAAGGMVDDVPEYIKKIKRDKDLYQTYISDMRKYGSTRVAEQVVKRAAERRAMIRLAATLPVGSPERRAILAGCEKMKSPAMQESCEAMKAGKKPGKGKAKSDDKKKDDGKMPAELLEKFKAKKAASGPHPKGRNWKDKGGRWVWAGSDGDPAFTVVEKSAPFGSYYKLQMLLPDGGMYAAANQKTEKEDLFKRAAELYKAWGSAAGFNLSRQPERWSKMAGKGDVPDALKKHQFTSEDNPNPKGNDKDGDGKSNEPKPAGLKGKKAGRASGQIMAEITRFADAFLPSLTRRVPVESLGDPKTLKQIQNSLVYAMSDLAKDVVMEERFGPKGGGQYKRQFGSVLSNPPPFSSQTAHWFEENRDAPKYTAAWKAMSGWAAREGISLDAGARIRAANSKKAALIRLAAALPVGSSERKTILRMAALKEIRP